VDSTSQLRILLVVVDIIVFKIIKENKIGHKFDIVNISNLSTIHCLTNIF